MCRCRPNTGVNVDTLPVHRHRPDGHASSREGMTRKRITGVFDPTFQALQLEHPDNQIDRMLRSAGDDNLVRFASDASSGAQVLANQDAKLWQAARIGVSEMAFVECPKAARAKDPTASSRERSGPASPDRIRS